MATDASHEMVELHTREVNVFTAFRRGCASHTHRWLYTIGLVIMYVTIGTLFYSSVEETSCTTGTCKWSIVDSIYFCTVTMSTVGYGDFIPSMPGTRAFTVLWIIIGIVFVFSALASGVGSLIHPLNDWGRQLLETWFPQKAVDLNGDGTVDYYVPRHWAVYYFKNMLPLFLIAIVFQTSCAAVFLAFEEWSYDEAIYHCIVTATTVGYGDMSITSDGGKLWAVFHIMVSVSIIGDLIATVDELREERRDLLAKVAQLSRRLDKELLDKCFATAIALRPDRERSGEGLSELEFVISMLLELGIVEMGKVRPFVYKFRELDADGTGWLSEADLDAMLRIEAEERSKTAAQGLLGSGHREKVYPETAKVAGGS
uniref:EF-hand domain-containing protein n=1 Tax=Alexandrium monilatum TaxID=311494 RepID=A0A7S4T1P3_9DINO